ncbi:hypothetical protein [Kocuria sp.]|uniref:hypothetical protein n=1 Tax=Kocuria sp. TaxID=1871328 RepID=UPI0026DEF960|nr:hypothetical protein [Kocuria sp.]MDO5619282.1 hypothetical protein [Kocuria sp.]
MPHKVVRPPAASRARSLGWLALWWVETFVVHGPGPVQREPIRHGDEYSQFIVDCYSLDGDGRRLIDSAFFSRPKGCNKSGLAAELVLFEALGPCRFEGWAQGGEKYEFLGQTYVYQAGEPMGRQVTAPFVRVMATEEGQTGNVYDQVHLNLTDGPLSEMKAYGLDAGLTRVILPYGGEITPSTAGSASKDGGKETFVVFDESHLYNTPQLRKMHNTVTRNLVKRKKLDQTWYIETTTMYAPGEESVAEATYKFAELIEESLAALADGGRPKFRGRIRMLYDHRWSDLQDLADLDKLEAAIEEAYGEALDWNSKQGVIDDIFDPRNTPEDARRYFLNALTEAHNAWVTPAQISDAIRDMPGRGEDRVAEGEEITLGFDGAQTDDATALVGCRVSDGYLFEIGIWECPDGPEAKDWRVDELAVDAAVGRAHERYKVVAFFADPPHWIDQVERWEREYADGYRAKASGNSAVKWWTKLDTKMALALQRLHDVIAKAQVKISANPVLVRHLINARRWSRRGGIVIGKEAKHSVKKMDGAMAATLAYEARAAVLNNPEEEQPETFVPFRVGGSRRR